MLWFYFLFILSGSGIGYALAVYVFSLQNAAFIGALFGVLATSLCVALGAIFYKFGTKRLVWGVLGFIVGACISLLVNSLIDPLRTSPVSFIPLFSSPESRFALQWVSFCLLTFLGVLMALTLEKNPHFLQQRTEGTNQKILDTSVIIDGRIADLCETGFLEGTFIMPRFVLQELQHIADSSDSIRRARGRRGLDVLDRLQKMSGIDFRITEYDFPAIREVDAKIVALAKHLLAKVATNDLNLSKVAELQGVSVLNMNRLSTALRPVVLPGETLRLLVSKEGKEVSQGVGYLDDGTMIVIDDARKAIGKKVDIVVTSVLQTGSGRMVFARMREPLERQN